MKKKYKNIVCALLGTIVEYYDYSLYGFSAAIIALKFFPNTDLLTGLANAFAIYAVAYVAKPLGALFFGYIGDKFGRKVALNFTIIGIVIPTTIIGILPEYEVWGFASLVILIICRMLQGVFTAGEYDGAAIYVIEHLSSKHRYTASAITRTTAAFGLLLGIGTTNFFNSHLFDPYGWRIPFLLSLPLGLVTLYYRKYLIETPSFAQIENTELSKTVDLLKKHWQPLLMAICLAGGCGVTYQVSVILMKQYLPIVLPQVKFVISTFSVVLVACFTISMPIAGLCADRFGKMIVIEISTVCTIISCSLLALAIENNMLNLALVSCMTLVASVAPFNALAHSLFVNGFSIKERYRGVSLGHTVGSLTIASSTNYICLVIMKHFEWHLFPIFYISFFAIISYLVILLYQRKYK